MNGNGRKNIFQRLSSENVPLNILSREKKVGRYEDQAPSRCQSTLRISMSWFAADNGGLFSTTLSLLMGLLDLVG